MGILGTAFFLIRFAFSFFGADAGIDSDIGEIDPDNMDFKFLSLQTISIFSLSAGWMGVFLTKRTDFSKVEGALVSLVFGLFCGFVEVWIFTKVKGLAQINVLNYKDAVGKIGKVYLKIPENGVGEIQIAFGGSLKNVKARSIDGEEIESFKDVEVLRNEENILVVRKL